MWWVLLGCGLAGIMVALDFTIVNASLANIQKDLNTQINDLQWVIVGFGLPFCALLVTAGRLGDLLGRRKILFIGIIGFGLASIGAGFSPTAGFLIAMRVIQGIFGAAILPCGMAITASAFPQEKQGYALGIYGSILGIGLAFGPVVGSIIDTLLNWRWIFFVNIPIILLSLGICIPSIKESRIAQKVKIDWAGAFFLMIFLISTSFAISEGKTYGWASTIIITAYFTAFISFIALCITEKRAATPIIPIHLILNSRFFLALMIYASTVGLAWPMIFLMPLYLHNIVGFSTESSGLILASMTIMTVISPIIAGHYYGKISRTRMVHLIYLSGTLGVILFLFFTASGPLALILIAFILFGNAWGMGNGIATPIALSKLTNTDDAGLISGALTTGLNTFGVISLTVMTALFRSKPEFMGGFHLACSAALAVTIILWVSSALLCTKR